MEISVEVYQSDESHFTARCREFELYSFGSSESEAVERINHVISFYLSTLEELGFDLETDDWEYLRRGTTGSSERFAVLSENNSLQ